MTFSQGAPSSDETDRARSAGVLAVLGPTNTGKTHFAIERMLSHRSGIIGLPLRLLAREVYGRVVEKVGAPEVALITGEEKIKPKNPRYWVATVEAMPRDLDVAFVAIDEIQLAADLDRGHVFTDRLLNRRGRDETLIIGAMTMRRVVEQLLPGVGIVSRPRLSTLSFAGERKLSRLPHRSAIVAFSAEEVYAIAELIRRQRGGAAVVLGALSPRTRNAQVALYQNGDVDYLVATDAIGMGLNLDLDHVAFAGERKFDGWQYRRLTPAEMGQIAGRAGRHLKDGTFGTTGRCPPMEPELVEALEDHRFDPLTVLQWRNSDLDFSSIEDLQHSLDRLPDVPGLTRAPLGIDLMVLEIAARDAAVRRAAKTRADVQRLWETCQVPDYRKLSPAAHAEMALTLFGFVVRAGRVPDTWFSTQLAAADRTDGDIDTLSARISQVRTLTYIANRPDWLGDPEHWQGVTRQLEDRLSDALHERLAQRFVDRRTSVLMRRLRENAMLEAEITTGGDVMVEGQHVGQLHGFRFTPDPQAAGEAARTLNVAALKALAGEIEARAERFSAAVDESFALANDGTIRWLGDPVAKIAAGDKLLTPRARVIADEHLTGTALETVQRRLDLWLAQHVKKHLGALLDLETGEGLDGVSRGIAFQVAEELGVLERSRVAEQMKSLDQASRGMLRKLGLRFGAYHIYVPGLIKPAPRALAAQLWALRHGGVEIVKGLDEVPHLAASGRTSFPADQTVPKGLYRAAGFRVCGARAVRVDILERLADLIRPAIAYRPGTTPGAPPPGAADNDGFVTTVSMTSLAGCSGEDFGSILKALGYVVDRRPGPAITVPLLPVAPTEPLRPHVEPGAAMDAAPPAAADDAIPDPGPRTDGPTEGPPATTADAVEAEDGLPGSAPETGVDVALPEADDAHQLAVELGTGAPPSAESHPGPEGHAEAAAGPEGSSGAEDLNPVIEGAAEPHSADEAEPVDTPPATAEPEAAIEPSAEPHTGPEEHAEAAAGPEGSSGAEVLRPSTESVVGPGSAGEAAPGDQPLAVTEPEAATRSDAPSDAQEPPEPEAPAEPVLIEVWRPHRTHHHAQRRPDRARPRPQRAEAQAGAGPGAQAGSGEPRAAEHRRDDRRPSHARGRHPGGAQGPAPRRDHPRPERPDGEPAAARGTQPEQHGRKEGGRPQRNGDGKARFEHRRGEDRRNEGGRGDARPQQFSTEARPSRDRPPDPNSPFAKLMALKLEMERKKEP
ncbi:MAG TPA: helicase-related protein [Lichenihabitans sp.]|jgi:ATP-dependent RNA helicase SUPV3L1/SUV3|nr:helicase-related protein [Lichenihabitans sp.]